MIFVNDFSPVLVELGPLEIRWYGVFFAIGVVLSYMIARWVFKREGYNMAHLDSVAVYLFLGMVIGARLGEVLFYNFGYFWENPVEIFKIWEGGLSSHGAVIGLFVAYFIWCRVYKVRFSKYGDALVLGIPLTAMFVRIGNFFNSEIIGVPTGGDWGVVFSRLGEDFTRHPAQLYEALLSLFVFVVLIFVYKKYYRKAPPLFFMFLLMLLYFTGRFFIEFVKDLHVLPEGFPLSMGQVLSILPIVVCVVYFIIKIIPMKKFISMIICAGLISITMPASSAVSSYDVWMVNTSYSSSDDALTFMIDYPDGEDLDIYLDIYDECGDLVSSGWGVEIYYYDLSPQEFYVPLYDDYECYDNLDDYCLGAPDSYPKNGSYEVYVQIEKWDDTWTSTETVYTDDSLSFSYDGWSPVCGDGVCSAGETCAADNCCDGVSTDLENDVYNCGSCGNVCYTTEACINGLCVEEEEEEEVWGEVECETAECEEALVCAMALTPAEGCMMELVDLVPVIDKASAVSLLYDDVCSMSERYEMGDPIGVAVTGALMIIDLADNALDIIPGIGNLASATVDAIEGSIDCVESFIYEYYLKPCGGYMWCFVDWMSGISVARGVTASATVVHSPVTIEAVDDFGNALGIEDGVFTFNFGDMKAVMVLNPEDLDGGYNVDIQGTDDGTYNLETTVVDETGEVKKEIKQEDLPVLTGQTISYKIEVPQNLDADEIFMERIAVSNPVTFTDFGSSHWAYNIVMDLTDMGIIKGYDDGTFRPEQSITRAELLKVAFEAFSSILPLTFGSGVVAKDNPFMDISSGDWVLQICYIWRL